MPVKRRAVVEVMFVDEVDGRPSIPQRSRRFEVPAEFADVLRWLASERIALQNVRFDYDDQESRDVADGVRDGSWFDRVLNRYCPIVEQRGLESPEGIQAIFKLAAAFVSVGEYGLRLGVERPPSGTPSAQ